MVTCTKIACLDKSPVFNFNYQSPQVISREQLYVCPTTEVNHDLPAGITADAVQSAATLPLVLKQVYLCTYMHVTIATAW